MNRRIDTTGVLLALLLIAVAAAAAYAALALGWFRSPWEMAGVLAAVIAFIAAGLGVHAHRQPKNASVYGAAKTATESEAQAAARGDTKTVSIHERTFPD